jgi:ketosteroid isomerase-like protein
VVIREVLVAFERRDVEAVLARVHPDVEFVAVTGQELGRGPYLGHDGLRQYFRDEAEYWDELRITAQDFHPAGEDVVATGRVWARAGARLIDRSAGWIWRVEGGKIRYGRAFASAAAALEAAGLDAAP